MERSLLFGVSTNTLIEALRVDMDETLYFLTQHGTAVLFVVVFAEQIGLPLPAVPLLVAAGVLAGTGHMNLWGSVGATVIATLTADWIWYKLGRRRGRTVLDWLCRIALEPNSCVRRTGDFFTKHGTRSLMLAKFLPGLSTIAPPLAGIVGMSVPLFLFYDALGTVLWVGASVGLGYVFSDQVEQALAFADHVMPAVVVIAMFALIGYVLYKAVRRRQLRRVPRITVEQLAEKLQTAEPPLLIDMRPRVDAEVAPSIPTAMWMSLEELAHRHGELPRHRELVLYCGCPEDAASVQGTILLNKLGFTRVWPLAGGIEAWHSTGVEAPEPARATEPHSVAA